MTEHKDKIIDADEHWEKQGLLGRANKEGAHEHEHKHGSHTDIIIIASRKKKSSKKKAKRCSCK
jgi:hypothetical protein